MMIAITIGLGPYALISLFRDLNSHAEIALSPKADAFGPREMTRAENLFTHFSAVSKWVRSPASEGK